MCCLVGIGRIKRGKVPNQQVIGCWAKAPVTRKVGHLSGTLETDLVSYDGPLTTTLSVGELAMKRHAKRKRLPVDDDRFMFFCATSRRSA